MTNTADKETLRWCGILGHTYVVLTDGGSRLETCDKQQAIAHALGEYKDQNPRVWNQYKAGKWRAVKLPAEAK